MPGDLGPVLRPDVPPVGRVAPDGARRSPRQGLLARRLVGPLAKVAPRSAHRFRRSREVVVVAALRGKQRH